jgi:hypothetical protein
MQNVGGQQFNYDVLQNAYDYDDRIKNIVKDFDKENVTLHSDKTDNFDGGNQPVADKDTVGQMAKRATKIGS